MNSKPAQAFAFLISYRIALQKIITDPMTDQNNDYR